MKMCCHLLDPDPNLDYCSADNRRKIALSVSVVTVIEIGTETAVFRQNRTETEVLCLSGGFENGAALVSTVR